MWNLRRFGLTGVCVAGCLLLLTAPVEAAFTIQQITNTGYDDFNPQVSGQHVVWSGEVAVGNVEVFHYNIGTSTTTQISNDVGPTYNDWYPMVSGADVVWEKEDPSVVLPLKTKIYHWNEGGVSTDLTPGNAFDNYNPKIDGRIVTWENRGVNSEIVVHDLMSGTQQNIVKAGDDFGPAVSGTNVVWYAHPVVVGANDDIFHFSATGANAPPWLAPLLPTAQITNDPRGMPPGTWHDDNPHVSGNNLVWQGWPLPNGNSDVFAYDLGAAVPTIKNISNSPLLEDGWVQVNGSIMVWQTWDGAAYQVSYCDLSKAPLTPIQITNSPHSNSDPQVSGHYIVWYGDTTPANSSPDPDNYEIFLYDTNIGQTFQVTNNQLPDWEPQIDGTCLVWSGKGANGKYEIFTTVVPEPATAVLLAIAGLVLAGYAWRRRRS